MGKSIYKRILLKISGEALSGSKDSGLDNETLLRIGKAVYDLTQMDVELAVVVGGGNFWRGRTSEGMDRVTADHMGMLATTMNALALADAMDQAGCDTRVMSAIEMRQIAETYIRKRALHHLEKGRVTVFACGTGNPFFSTDTAMALRAAEIDADIIFKATNVDGVFDSDPKHNPNAIKYQEVSHSEVLNKDLKVMDSNAAAICRDNHLKIIVFNLNDPQNIVKIAEGETNLGTLVY